MKTRLVLGVFTVMFFSASLSLAGNCPKNFKGIKFGLTKTETLFSQPGDHRDPNTSCLAGLKRCNEKEAKIQGCGDVTFFKDKPNEYIGEVTCNGNKSRVAQRLDDENTMITEVFFDGKLMSVTKMTYLGPCK